MATKIGYSITEFWQLTPYEFNLVVEGYAERKKQEQEMMITQAYMISRWVWAKKLNLENILKNTKPKKEMTDDQMMKMCMSLNRLFGGSVKK